MLIECLYIIIIYYDDFNDLNYYCRICLLSTYSESSHSQSLLQAIVILDSDHFCTLFNSY